MIQYLPVAPLNTFTFSYLMVRTPRGVLTMVLKKYDNRSK